MERRHFLATALGATAALRFRRIRAQSITTRGAVVIGVDKPGNLPALNAAKSGARSVASWLQGEGFDVKTFVDDGAPVTVTNVFAAINAFVQAGTLEQLVVYFAGHGFISGTLSEFWMLSGAPQNPNEAVSLTESCKYAEESGIPNVVFISDACRSLPSDLGVQRVQGGVLFPSKRGGQRIADVDQFLAARIGSSAYEVAPAGDPAAAHGIFTACFLEAFKNPYPSMVHTIDGRPVVPNRRLKTYLAAEVPKRAQALSVAYNQIPDSKVYSDEPTYIAHVSTASRGSSPAPTASLTDVAAAEIWPQSDPVPGRPIENRGLQALRASSGFGQARDIIVSSRGFALELRARSGLTISGRRVAQATARKGIAIKVSNSPADSRSATSLVEVDLGPGPAASVALRFEDGSGTVLAALRDYVGNIVVQPEGVKNVSYVPSRQSPMREDYERESVRLEQLRASVATAAQFGVFRFDGPKEDRKRKASAMADSIRVLKGIDPTLGLYAAYAYDEAGLRDKVRSVREFMRSTLNVGLFDIEMLDGSLSGAPITAARSLVPFCPMLSQGWGLLRVSNVQLPERVLAARAHLQISLWNWLDDDGMTLVEDALRRGDVA
ncbi:MAG: caspase family protein [Gammaproteobacteria bacterium]